MLNRKEFIKLAVKLSFPIMVQNVIGTLVNMADTIMLGEVSQEAMAAASLANQFSFVLFCFYFGLAAATSVLCAQYWGKGDKNAVEKVIGMAVGLAFGISIAFVAIGMAFPVQIMRLFTESPETVEIGSQYLRVVSVSYLFMGITQVLASAIRSVGKVLIITVTSVVSLVVNIFFNATFIFGLFGAPKLGVVGVAIGTIIARVTETTIALVYMVVISDVKIRFRYLFSYSKVLMKDFLKIGSPAVINDVAWSLAASAFAAILGHIGDDMVAANAVAIMVVNIGAIASRGFSNATTIVVSNALGENNMEAGKVYGRRMLYLTIFVSLIGCAVILLIRPWLLDYYSDKLSPTAVYYLGAIMIMTTWRLVGEGMNTCWICGCFRGGGDSRFGMICDIVFMWFVAVPLMAIAAYVLKWPPLMVYLVMSLDEFYKMPVVYIHYKRYKWLNNITRDEL